MGRKQVMIESSATDRIYEVTRCIPKGKVATYGQIALLAGNPRMARAVGNALHRNPQPGIIPCHRVVNAAGKLAENFGFGGAEVQADMLKAEGVEVVDGRVDLGKYQAGDEEILRYETKACRRK